MGLPLAVQQAEERANALYTQVYGDKTAQEPAPQGTPQPATETNTQAAPVTTPEDTDTWESKYRVLTGKYNAEVPRLSAENRSLAAEVASLKAKIESLQKAQQAAPVAPTPLVKPEEVEQFGEPMIDVVRRAAREEITKVVPQTALPDEVVERLDRIEKTTAATVEQNFFSRLTELVPDWVVVNEDKRFHAWLAETDPLTGMERQSLLAAAQSALDPVRVSRFFTSFAESIGTRAAAATAALEPQVTPDSRANVAHPRGKPVFTRREIDTFYMDWRAGRISDADAVAKEAEINLALREGRVR